MANKRDNESIELGHLTGVKPPRKNVSWSESEKGSVGHRRSRKSFERQNSSLDLEEDDTRGSMSSEDSSDQSDMDEDDFGSPITKRDLAKYSTGRRDSAGSIGSFSAGRRMSLSRQNSRYTDRIREEHENAQVKNINFIKMYSTVIP